MFGFNWVDLILLVAFFAVMNDGKKSDLITEILKAVGTILATFVTLHYYIKLSALLQGKVFVPQDYRDLFSYAFLIGLMLIMITMIRNGWLILLGIDVAPFLERWGKTIVAGVRAYLMAGLLFLALFVSNNESLMDQARGCKLAPIASHISLDIYHGAFRFLSKFFPEETINVDALVLMETDRKSAKAVMVQFNRY
jgi:uncharacterized membrane protein required for colicin V production